MSKAARFDIKNVDQLAKNLAAPYYGTDRIVGTTYQVLIETIVENIVRRLTGMRIPVSETAMSLALGKPFEGMFYFGEAPDVVKEQDYTDSAMTGLQTAPGQFVGQYLMSVFKKGFVLPRFDFRDMAVTALSKSVSRPLMKFLAEFLPKKLNDQINVLNVMLLSQKKYGAGYFVKEDDGGLVINEADLRRR